MSTTLKITALIAMASLLTMCKKYPENNLWFKNPDKLKISKSLVAFSVNGVDSMPMWDAIYNDPTTSYNAYCVPMKANQIGFYTNIEEYSQLESQIGSGQWHFFDNKKYVYIYFWMNPTDFCANQNPKYNLFLTSESTWKVLKLTKDGNFKIQRTYNDKVYEIEFN